MRAMVSIPMRSLQQTFYEGLNIEVQVALRQVGQLRFGQETERIIEHEEEILVSQLPQGGTQHLPIDSVAARLPARMVL